MLMTLLTEPGQLNAYHQTKSKAAKQEVEEMSKQPLSRQQVLNQLAIIKAQMMQDSDRKTR